MTTTAAPAATARAVTREAYRDRLIPLLGTDPRLMCLDTDTGLFGPDHIEAAASSTSTSV